MPFDKSNAGGSSSFAEGAQQLVNVFPVFICTLNPLRFMNFPTQQHDAVNVFSFQIYQFCLFCDKKA